MMPTLHDTIRFLIRGYHFPDESQQRAALLSVDAHERQFGTADTDAFQKELEAQAAAAARRANPDGPETDAEKAARLEAENVRLQALVAAQVGRAGPVASATPPPGT